MRPRLASGLGTIYLSVDFGRSPQGASAAKPSIECVREPRRVADGDDDDDAWRVTARDDYLWMAKEFNRQYMNSHGKEHDDYQPHSAADALQLHYLNGRSVARDPTHAAAHCSAAWQGSHPRGRSLAGCVARDAHGRLRGC